MKGWYGNKHKHSLASRGIRSKEFKIDKKNELWSFKNLDKDKINTIIEYLETDEDDGVWGISCVWASEPLSEISGGIKFDGWVYDEKGEITYEFDNIYDSATHSWVILKDGTIIDATFLQFIMKGYDMGDISDITLSFGDDEREYNGKKYPKHMIAIIPKNHPKAKMYNSHNNNYSKVNKKIRKEVMEEYERWKKNIRDKEGVNI